MGYRLRWLFFLVLPVMLGASLVTAQDDPARVLQVVDSAPLVGEELALDDPITLFFDRDLDCATVETAFSITPQVDGDLTCDATRLTFTPSNGFDSATTYTVTLDESLRGADGAQLLEPYTLMLATTGFLQVTQVLPDAGTQDVATDAVITVIFNRPVVPLGSVEDMANLPDPLTIIPEVPGVGEWLNTAIYTFTPDPAWAGGTMYEVVIDAGLEAVDGATLPSTYGWTFSTEMPRVIGVIPEDASGAVPLDQTIQMTFNQPMDQASVEEAFELVVNEGATVTGEFEWAEDGMGFRFTPDDLLTLNTTYQLSFRESPRALAGGILPGERDIRVSTFVTVPPPAIIGTVPTDGAQNAQPYGGIGLSFASPMDESTFEGRVIIDPEPWRDPEFYYNSFNNDLRVSFPTEPSANYTITVEAGMADVWGNTIDTPLTFSFSTGPYDSSLTLNVPGNVGFYDAAQPETRLFVNHRNISRLELELFTVPVDEFARRLVNPNNYEPTHEYLPSPDNSLVNWQIESVAPQNALRYELLNLGEVVQETSDSVQCPGAMPSRVRVGDSAIVITDPEPVRARAAPIDGEIIELLYRDYVIPVVEGPVCSPGLTWWGVRLRDERIAWVAEAVDGEYFIDLRAAAQDTEVTIPTSSEYVDEDGSLAPGIYFLRVNSPETAELGFRPSAHFMVVGSANLLMKSTVDSVLIWATDVGTGRPIPDTPITLYDQNFTEIVTGITNADGLLRLEMNAIENLDVPHMAIMQTESHFGLGYSRWSNGIDPWQFGERALFYPQQYSVYLYTDRPIYRPDQPVYFRGVVRSQDDVTYTVPDLGTVPVVVTNNMGEIVYDDTLELSPFGTVSGQFDLAEDASLGSYQIRIELPSTQEFRREGGSVAFSVAEYRLPEFQVELESATPEVVQDSTIEVTLNSTYFFGGVVSNAEVQYNVITQPYSFQYEGRGRYDFTDFDPDAGPSAFYGTSRGLVADGTGTTDERGNLTIEVPAELGDATQSQEFVIEATVTDESDQAVSGRTTVVVHQGLLYVGVRPENYVATANEETQINIIAVDWDSDTIADQQVTVEVVERRWSSVQERDPATGRTTWTWEVEEIPVADGEVTTNENGTAEFAFTPPDGGVYSITVISRDSEGNEVRASTSLWVSSRNFVAWRQQNSNRIDLVPDNTDYAVGDTAQILITSPFQGETEALITVERGEVLYSERITMESNSTIYELPITADYAPNVYVSVLLIKGITESNPVAAFRMGLVRLGVDNNQLELGIDISTDVEQAGPRETVTYTVRTTNYQGEPVSAEVGVGVTDLAALSIGDPNSGPILSHFYGPQGLAVRTSTPLTISTDQLTQTVIDTIKGGGGGFGEGGIFDIREEFVDTAFWNGAIVTDEDGTATFEVTLPDNLTTWRLDARAITLGDDGRMLVGQDTFDLLSTKPLLIRPVTPRFFVVGDEVVLAAIVNNNSDSAQTVEVTLAGSGINFTGETIQTVDIAEGGRARIEWRVTIADVENVDLTFSAVTTDAQFADASRPPLGLGEDRLLPVYRYEAPETTGTGGILRSADTRTEGIVLPQRFDVTQGELTINVEPSLAASSLSTLDALYGYRWESIESVVSRFLPNIMTFRTFNELGITTDRDLRADLNREVQFAIQRLYAEQKVDGGWGWYVQDPSNALVTAYALIGLVEASEIGFAVDPNVIRSAIGFIETQYVGTGLNTQDWRLDRQAFLLYAVAQAGSPNVSRTVNLYEERARLSLYARALLVMTFHEIDPTTTDRIDTLTADLLADSITSANGIHWEEADRDFWNWNTDTRTTAMVLQALTRVMPESDLLPNIVRWLMVARSGDTWETIQETAWSLMALTDYMTISGDLRPDYPFGVTFNDTTLIEGQTTPDNATVMRRLVVDVAEMFQSNTLNIERGAGDGALYYTAYLRVFLPVPEIEAINRGIIVERQYSLLDDPDHTPITEAQVGQLVQVRLTVIAPNDLHYVRIEDPIPAGTDAVNPDLATSQQIGTRPELNPEDPLSRGWGWWYFSNIQFEDERVVLNSTYLPAGTYEYVYTIRTGLPGVFNVIPATAQETYFPDVFGRSAGTVFTITAGE